MKLSGNKIIETIMEQKAKGMVESIEGEIPLVPFKKDPKQATFALLTTAGAHLKSQEPFEVVEGDHTVRFIPSTATEEDLMISHEHFDREDADLDINCIFPLTRLKEIYQEGIIGDIAKTHYGMMGYIPNTAALIEETIPKIIEQLKIDQVDALLLNPGWYICHQSVGLVQYYVEKAGIPTISISHLINLTEKVRVPRSLFIRFPLGRSFGQAYESELQKEILLQLIQHLGEINTPETIIKLPYKWKRRKK